MVAYPAQLQNVLRRGPLSQAQIDAWLRNLRGNPSPRESGFDVTVVGRAIIGMDDQFYFGGVNAEQIHHRLTTHGEDGVIAALTTGLGKFAFLGGIDVMGAPRELTEQTDNPMGGIEVTCCGKCRQNVNERAINPQMPVRSISLNGKNESTKTIGELLICAFGFADFNQELQTAKKEGLSQIKIPDFDTVANRLMRFTPQTEEQVFTWLNELESAAFASGVEQNVVIKLKDGTYIAGVKCEDAAYTGLSAVQSATAIAAAADGYHSGREIEGIWILTRDNGKILQPHTMQALALSDAQILLEFGATLDVPIHLFNESGEQKTIALGQTPYFAPTFDSPVFGNRVEVVEKFNALTDYTVDSIKTALSRPQVSFEMAFMGVGRPPISIATIKLNVDVNDFPKTMHHEVPAHVRKVAADYFRRFHGTAQCHPFLKGDNPFMFSDIASTDVKPNGTLDIIFKADHLQTMGVLLAHGYNLLSPPDRPKRIGLEAGRREDLLLTHVHQ